MAGVSSSIIKTASVFPPEGFELIQFPLVYLEILQYPLHSSLIVVAIALD